MQTRNFVSDYCKLMFTLSGNIYLKSQTNNILWISRRLFAIAWGILSWAGIFSNTDTPSYSVLIIAKKLALFEWFFFCLVFHTVNCFNGHQMEVRTSAEMHKYSGFRFLSLTWKHSQSVYLLTLTDTVKWNFWTKDIFYC